jgi:hypothetical protein
MKNIKYFILFIFIACSNKNKKASFLQSNHTDYKMINYESKAYVDPNDFPTIKIFGDYYYQAYVNNFLIDEGQIIKNADTFIFKINKAPFMTKMDGYFLNQLKDTIRLQNLFAIGVEANYGDFIKIN